MKQRRSTKRTELFLVRVWTRSSDDGSGDIEDIEWEGKVQRVTNGETHEFSSWQSLKECFLAMLPNHRGAKPP